MAISNCTALTTGDAESVTIGQQDPRHRDPFGCDGQRDRNDQFKLYGPFTGADPTADTCVAGTLKTTIAGTALSGPDADGDFTSTAEYTPDAIGRYRWVATFTSGDGNNVNAGPTECLDAAEVDTVVKAQPTITTGSAQSVIVGSTINDTATVSGAAQTAGAVGGTVEFKLYGPFAGADPTADTCVAGNLLATIAGSALSAPDANGDVTSSASYSATNTVGRYRWVATYSGDTKNLAAGPTACLDPAEVDTVGKQQPLDRDRCRGVGRLRERHPRHRDGDRGCVDERVDRRIGHLQRVRSLHGRGSSADTCVAGNLAPNGGNLAGSALTSDGNGGFTSSVTYTPGAVGRYRWVASYSGDAKNEAAGPTACLDSG